MKKFIFVAFLLAGACALSLAQAPNGVVPATYFGQDFITPNGGSAPYNTSIPIGSLGKEAGASWSHIEPNAPVGSGCPGTTNCTHSYNWAPLDAFLTVAKAHGLYFQWVQDLAPPWATNNVGCSGTPPQCDGVITDTVDFGAFIDAMVTRYNVGSSIGTINAYEMGNESDYRGTPAQYAAQWTEMINHIKAHNTSALIVAYGQANADASFAPNPCPSRNNGGQDNCFDSIWAAFKANPPSSGAHLDALAIHGYPHTYTGMPETVIGGPGTEQNEACNNGYAPCTKAAISRNNVTSYTGAPVQVWDTEGGWGVNNQCGDIHGCLSVAQQVGYLGRYMLVGWAAGIQMQNWYSWDNGQWGCLSCQAALQTAYTQLHDWIVGSTFTSWATNPGGYATPCWVINGSTVVWNCKLSKGGVQYLAVWNTSGSSSYTISAGQWFDYRDLAGGTTSIGNTVTSVNIGIQPILLETSGSSGSAPAAPTGLSATVQ